MNPDRVYHSLWMVVAGLLFALMGVFVKIGAARFSFAELVFYRSLFGFFAIALVMSKRPQALATPYWKMQLSRGVSGFAALMLFFYAITHLPLAAAITLNYTSPIFLAIFTAFFLRTRISPALTLAIGTGFMGVVLLLGAHRHLPSLAAAGPGLVSGMLAGLAYLQVAELGKKGEPEWRTVFYFTLISVIGSGLWAATTKFHLLTLNDLPLLAGLGASATAAQLAMTRSYTRGEPLVSASLAYSTVVFACLFDIFLWHETLSAVNMLGILMIAGGGVASIRATSAKAGQSEPLGKSQ